MTAWLIIASFSCRLYSLAFFFSHIVKKKVRVTMCKKSWGVEPEGEAIL